MASEITEEDEDIENHPCMEDKEAEKTRIRRIIAYQRSLYFSSSSSSSFSSAAAASTSSFTSPRRSSRLLDLMREGSTSLRRLFDMEHTSLGNYFKDYTVSPIIKPVLLWGGDTDSDVHDDPWAELKIIGGSFDSRNGHQNGILSSKGSFNDEEHMQHSIRLKTRRRKLIRTKSYKSLPRFSFWRCGVGFKFRLRLIRKLRIMIRGKKL
ncbi:UNVERIFIED_CONTAM: hypothetical protein Sradi_3447600 [Sesamum radiatum]|uniref:Uncharacterized protein n=1 Tax=Sesamum radiatum TaxID=300843 RepID=A0AAW2R5W3_SESRA